MHGYFELLDDDNDTHLTCPFCCASSWTGARFELSDNDSNTPLTCRLLSFFVHRCFELFGDDNNTHLTCPLLSFAVPFGVSSLEGLLLLPGVSNDN